MTVPRSHPGSDGPKNVAACFREVAWARAQLGEARATRPGLDLRGLRAELLAALEAYEAVLTDVGAPVPPRLRQEILLYRHLSGRQ